MDVNKFKSLKVIKTSRQLNGIKITKKYKKSVKAPHAIKCEVLLSHNQWYALINNDKYPLEIRDIDYENAEYAYSSEENPHWDSYTLKLSKFNKKYIDNYRKYWVLVKPYLKAFVSIENGIAHLNMLKMNNKMNSIIAKHKATYYANRRHPML